MRADAVAQLALQLHAILRDRAATAAGALQLSAKRLEELFVFGEAEDHRDGLAAAALLLHAQLGDRAIGNRFFTGGEILTALAIIERPAALGAGAAAIR